MRLAIAGFRHYHILWMYDSAKENPNVEIAGCLEEDAQHREATKKKYNIDFNYNTYDELLADKTVDAVAIGDYFAKRGQMVIKALKAGKYVFLEKPIALNYMDAERLVAASKKYPGKLYCRHNRRFEQSFKHIREIMQSGILGDVYEIRNTVNSYQRRDDWQAVIECGGGQLNNWGPHIIDHMLQMLESPVAEVWSDLKKVTAVGDAEDHVRIILKGENKRLAEVEISGGVAIPGPSYVVHGTRGTLICEGDDIRLKYLDPNQKLDKITASKASPPIDGSFGRKDAFKWVRKTIMVEASNPDTEFDIYKYVYNAIRKGEKFPVTIEQAAEVVRITEIVKNNSEFKMQEKKTAKATTAAKKGTRRK